MMKKMLLLCSAAMTALFGWAAAPTQEHVTMVAQTLVEQSLQGILPDRTVETAEWVALEDNLGVWAVKLAPSGHLVLADSTKYRPLISFSENDFVSPEKDTPHYASLLAAAQRVAAAEATDGEENTAWTVNPYAASFLATSADPSTEGGIITAQPIDTAAWYQEKALAWYVPGTAPCGCVATAQAQGMHALQWPIYPERFFETNLSYVDSGSNTTTETYRFAPYSKFDYSKMSNTYADLDANTADNNQVARLVLMNDIISKMDFKYNVSTTLVPPATVTPWMTNLDKRTRTGVGEAFTTDDKAAIKTAMEAGFPVVCNTTTHAILASGYATINDVPYVRLNYGYANYQTTWYSIDDSIVLTFAITNPTKAVQCDPLPAISSDSPTISWHLPKCYAGDYTSDVTSFSVKAIPVTDATTTWTCSDFTTGAIAGNTRLLTVDQKSFSVNMGTQYDYEYPFIYYTLDPLFIPTAESTWNTTYTADFGTSSEKVTLQVLPLGGAWENVATIATTPTGTPESVSLAKYAGKPCKLRYFINTLNTWKTFEATAVSVTATQFADKNSSTTATADLTLDGKEVLSSFSRQFSDLTAGTAYVFAVTPTFDSKDEGTTGYCYTRIADGSTYVEEDFATFTVTSPSAEAQSNENMQIEDNFFRYCTYNGTSYIRVNAGEKVKTLKTYSSHPTAFPDDLFTVTEHGNGIFDIVVNEAGTAITPTQNDRVNLSLVATTEAGTISSHELSLAFDNSKAVAESEPTAPEVDPGEDPVELETPAVELPDAVYTNTLGGDSLLFVDGTAYTATSYDAITDIDDGTNIALYEAKSKDDNGANVAHSANIVKEHTVSGWFKLNETGKTTTLWVVRNDAASYSGYIVQITDAGKLKIARASGTGIQDSAIESTDVAVNDTNWHHITISFDWYYKSDAADYQWHRLIPRAYIDGTPISIDEESLGVVCSVNGAIRCDYFHIDAGVTAAGVTVYGATLTAEQVAAIDRTANLAEVPTVENPLEPIYTNTLGVGATFEAYDGVTYRANAFTATTDIASLGASTGSFGGIFQPATYIATHSVSAWFKVAAERTGNVVLWAANNNHADLGGYSVQLTAAGAIQMGRTKANDGSSYENNNSVATADGVIADGNWHYITMTFSWATGNNLTPLLYVDGEAVAFSDTSKTITCGLNGPQSCTNFKIGAGVTAAGLAVYGDVIPADDVFAYYANSNAYLADLPTATAVTIDESSVYSSKLAWDHGAPTAELAATITANTATTIHLEEALTAAMLTIEGNTVTFSGETDLTASATLIKSDMDVSGITANLGAVTIAEGKTLTIGANTTLNSLSGGALVIDATVTASDNLLELLRAYNGKVTFKGATTLEYAANSSELIAQFIYESGTHYLKYGRSIQGGFNFATGKGDDDPTIRVKTGATLNMGINDLSGWQGSVAANPAVIRVENGATLNWMTYSTGSTGFFRDRLILDGGATVENAGENYCFILHGEAGTDPAKAQIAMLDSGTPVEATFNGIIPVHNYKYGGGGAGETGGSISVGRNATLNVGTLKGEDETLRKLGNGTLAVKTAVEGAFTLVVDAGTLAFKVNATPTNKFTGTGTITADSCTLDLSKNADIDGFSGSFAVANGGVLILPAGKEGNIAVADDCTLKLVLSEEQLADKYESAATGAGTIAFVKVVDGEYANVTEGVSGGSYYNPERPTWTPISAKSSWTDKSLWTFLDDDTIPTSGAVIIDASKADFDVTAELSKYMDKNPPAFTSINVIGNVSHVTSVIIGNADIYKNALTITIHGRVMLNRLILDNSHGLITVDKTDGVLLSDVTFSTNDATAPKIGVWLDPATEKDAEASSLAYGHRDDILWSTNEEYYQSMMLYTADAKFPIFAGLLPGENTATLNRDTWMNIVAGNYSLIAGGNSNTSENKANNVTGDIWIEMAGGTASYLIGGNWKDALTDAGAKASITGDITVVVRDDARIDGSIFGGSSTAMGHGTLLTGNTHVVVKNIQQSGTGAAKDQDALKINYIGGGDVYVSGASPESVITGNTKVTVDLTSLVGINEDTPETFTQNLVGGSTALQGGTNRVKPSFTITGNSAIEITAPNVVTFGSDVITGGSYIYGTGSTAVGGNSSLTLNGGTYEKTVVAGSTALDGGTATDNSVTMTLQSGVFTGATLLPYDGDVTVTNGSTMVIDGNIDLSGASIGSEKALFTTVVINAGDTLTIDASTNVYATAIEVNGTLVADGCTIPANVTITGNGEITGTVTINGDLTFEEGTSLNPAGTTLTVSGAVTATGLSVVATDYGPVLTAGSVTASNCTTTLDGAIVAAADTALCIVERPSLVENDVQRITDAAASAIAQAAANVEVYSGVKIPADVSDKSLAAAELFQNVVAVDNEANVSIDYDFGIESITVQNLDGVVAVSDGKPDTLNGDYVVITATVLSDVATANYADGTVIKLYQDDATDPLTSVAVITEAEPTPGRVRLAVSYNQLVLGQNDVSKTFKFTVKATNAQ